MNTKGMEKRDHVVKLLEDRGAKINDMAEIVYDSQYKYSKNLTVEYCAEIILSILAKTEIQNAIMLGIEIDKLHEKGLMEDKYLNEMISTDAGIFGLDEIVGLNLTYCYGTIAITNFGYLDKVKPKIIGKLDNSKKQTNVFLDDLVCGICAAACGKLAHNQE
jgi:phosphatidylglycerophosphatase A